MADVVFNVSKGRLVENHDRVDGNDPANAVLVLSLWFSSGLVTDATMIDYDTFAAISAGASSEATGGGYARIILDDTDIAVSTVDDTNDERWVDFADPVWSSLGPIAEIGALIVGYDSDSTTGTDANIEPETKHDFVITPNGGDVTGTVASNGYAAGT